MASDAVAIEARAIMRRRACQAPSAGARRIATLHESARLLYRGGVSDLAGARARFAGDEIVRKRVRQSSQAKIFSFSN